MNTPSKKEKKTILCMYSGGLDSLGVLYLLLTDKKYESFNIHVHHLILKNIEKRDHAEQIAVRSTIEFFKKNKFRKFTYSESAHDYTFLRRYFIFDTYWYAFMAANIMIADQSIMHVAVGRTKGDIGSGSSMRNANRGHEIFHATLPLEIRFHRSYIYPVMHLEKKEIWDLLPKDLRGLSWSCRRPIYRNQKPHRCGKCNTCKEMKAILNA